jgi:hypothetical protein
MISNGLVGYWTFDGGSIDWRTNTIRDVSGNGNTGSLVTMSTSSSPTLGKIGQAMKFQGFPDRISMGNVLHPTGAFTYSAWVYVTNFDAGFGSTIMSRYDSSTGLGLEERFGFNNTDGSLFSLGVYGPTNSDSMYKISMELASTITASRAVRSVQYKIQQ